MRSDLESDLEFSACCGHLLDNTTYCVCVYICVCIPYICIYVCVYILRVYIYIYIYIYICRRELSRICSS
jgi:hypothetical protein